MKFKKIKQRGQVLALYGILIPFLFLFVGVGLDLGWYYLNVSRLQNAADAAALAGALELVEEDKTMKNYFVDGLVFAPSDLMNEKDYSKFNIQTVDGVQVTDVEILQGKTEARAYASKNLYDVEGEHATLSDITSANEKSAKSIINEWTNNGTVSFTAELYTKVIDYTYEDKLKRASDGIRYYQVTLNEKIRHLFLGSWFEPMDATIVACALIKPRDQDLVTIMNALQKETLLENWEYQKKYGNFTKKWNHYRYSVNGQKRVSYKEGDTWKTETVNVTPVNSQSSAVATEANGGKIYSEQEVDAINIDFNQDFEVTSAVSKDWDIRQPTTVDGATVKYINMDGWSANYGYDMRIQGLINLNGSWQNRNLMDSDTSNDTTADPLWARIEADPMWSKGVAWNSSGQTSLNSVHQMIINVNTDNTDTKVVKDADGKDVTVYKYRPFVIVYMGPETNETNSTVRQSQPVILNLNEDFNGILYAPNSPVIINGNGHKLTGFVIAQEYLFLKTDADFISEGYIETTDTYGHTIFVKEDNENLITEAELNKLIADNEYMKSDKNNGDVLLYEKVEAPRYLIIDGRYVKGLSGSSDANYVKALKKYKKITDADIVRITFPQDTDTFGGYVNTATYAVAKTDLLEAKPTTNANNYVEVILNVDGTDTTRYIAKTNLPYVRVYRNSNGNLYPYVPVCDLRVKTTPANKYEYAGGSHPYGYAGVTLADDEHDVYSGGNVVASLKDYVIDESMDTWKVERTALDVYQNLYKKSGEIIKTVDEDSGSYFILKSEIKNEPELVAQYHKITLEDGTVKYLKDSTTDEYNEDGASYYVKVTESGTNSVMTTLTPPIIVDNKGDLQTKRLTPSELFDCDTVSENMALRSQMENASDTTSDMGKYWNTYTRATNANEQPGDSGQTVGEYYRGLTGYRTKKEYKIPAFERVYYKNTFNLSENSMYSYFNIDELVRVNYLYMNVDELNHKVNDKDSDKWKVDDMFFTTRRASWID
ncbi:MAG: hypothetical protein IJK81_09610 [Selenomonadaceae bacterium]|nr:hypothetical protein [Selenomonadaceae bacterium]